MDYTAFLQAERDAAQALYAAQDAALAAKATWRETGADSDFDAYFAARLLVDAAREKYDDMQAQRVSGAYANIRKA